MDIEFDEDVKELLDRAAAIFADIDGSMARLQELLDRSSALYERQQPRHVNDLSGMTQTEIDHLFAASNS